VYYPYENGSATGLWKHTFQVKCFKHEWS